MGLTLPELKKDGVEFMEETDRQSRRKRRPSLRKGPGSEKTWRP